MEKNEKTQRIKILKSSYEKDKNIVRLFVRDLDDQKEITWAISGEDFDSLINQMANTSLTFSPEQREVLMDNIIGKIVRNVIKIDLQSLPDDLSDTEKVKQSEKEFTPYYDLIVEELSGED
jgi:hypothetical protein